MILNISGRTDIVAFYSPWFLNRLKEGFVDVRNPLYPTQVSRIYFSDVDGIVFCTKNPIPMLSWIDDIKIPFLIHITLTPYKKDIEPNVFAKGKIIEAIKKLSFKVGSDKVFVRYDPILINDKYSVSYHIKAFENLCKLLDGYVSRIIVSFVDNYKNVQKNINVLRIKPFDESIYKEIGTNFSKIAKKYHMTVQTCSERRNLGEYGFLISDCLTKEMASELTNQSTFKKWRSRNNKNCNCVEMVDIGGYNTCPHFCKYCYANYDEEKVIHNKNNHDPNSTMLVGHVNSDDIIKIRH